MSTLPVVTFGALLRRARLAAGLSQEELAERAQLSREAISSLERGVRRAPHKETTDLLADALALLPAERARLHQAARGQLAAASVPHLPEARELLPLAGREPEVARLERHLAGEGPPLLLLAGEPGIGKSRLLQETALRARTQGWTVLAGGCHRRSGQEPFAPLLFALESALRRAAPAALRAQLDGCAWLVRLLPELAETTLAPAPSWSLPPEQERRLMFAAVARYLANVAGPAGTLLVLDDLQWAGVDALDLLATLLRSPGEHPLRVVGAYRSTEVRPPDPLLALLADLGEASLAGEMRLGPLAPEEASALLQSVLEAEQATDSTLLNQLVERTGGVPYFLVSCAQALWISQQEGGPAPEAPWNVAQSIRQRIAALPELAQELLCAAAVVGREVPGTLLLALAAQSPGAPVAALEELDQARLLVEGEEARYQFPHDLIREVILADLSALRRRHWHAQVAEVLEQGPGEPPAEQLSYHYVRAGVEEKALLYLERAGDRAAARYAYSEAAAAYQETLVLLERLGRLQEAARVRERLGTAFRRLARFDEALETLEQAVDTYQRVGDLEGVARATALIGWVHNNRRTVAEGLARLEPLAAALSKRGPSLGLAELYLQIAQLYNISGRYHQVLEATEQAATHAPEGATTASKSGRWQLFRAAALYFLGRLEEAVPLLEEVVATADEPGVVEALNSLAAVYLARGAFEEERRCIERGLELAERTGNQPGMIFARHRRGRNAFFRGDWAQARLDLEYALKHVDQAISPYFLYFGVGLLRLAEGKREEAKRLLGAAVALAEGVNELMALRWTQYILAERDLLEGNPAGARARLEPLLDRGEEPETDVTRFLPMLAWAQLDLGEEAQAETTIQQALARARAQQMRPALADALRVQALLCLQQQRWEEAQTALEEALALCQAMAYPWAEAKVLYASGLLYQAKGEPDLARTRLEAALAILNRLGERLYAEQVERAMGAGRHP